TALELLADREIGRIRKPPERPEARVQHLGERFRALDCERAQGVRPDVLPPILPTGRELPHALAAGDGEEGDGVVHVVPDVVGEAEALAVRLPRELEARELPTRAVEDDHRVAGGARPVPAVHTVRPQQALGDGVVLGPLDGVPTARAACSARTRSTRPSRVTAEKSWFARSSPSIASLA